MPVLLAQSRSVSARTILQDKYRPRGVPGVRRVPKVPRVLTVGRPFTARRSAGSGRTRPTSGESESAMKFQSLVRWLTTLGVAALLLPGTASAEEVRVMISAGFFSVYAELGPAFERATGHRLVTTRGPSMGDSPEAIPTRLARGETADVVILDGGAADELGQKGFVRADSKVELARSRIGMVVRAGAAKPDIGSVEA